MEFESCQVPASLSYPNSPRRRGLTPHGLCWPHRPSLSRIAGGPWPQSMEFTFLPLLLESYSPTVPSLSHICDLAKVRGRLLPVGLLPVRLLPVLITPLQKVLDSKGTFLCLQAHYDPTLKKKNTKPYLTGLIGCLPCTYSCLGSGIESTVVSVLPGIPVLSGDQAWSLWRDDI